MSCLKRKQDLLTQKVSKEVCPVKRRSFGVSKTKEEEDDDVHMVAEVDQSTEDIFALFDMHVPKGYATQKTVIELRLRLRVRVGSYITDKAYCAALYKQLKQLWVCEVS